MQTQTTQPTQTLQPAQTTPQPASAPGELPEFPYVWFSNIQDPATGWVECYTVRAVSEAGFIQRIGSLKAELIGRGYVAAQRNGHSASAAQASESAANPAPAEKVRLCPKHNTPLERRAGKNGGAFYSCPQKDNGKWCPWKEDA